MNATESYKDYRKYLILNMINHFQPVSRTHLVKLTNFQPAIVTALVKELADIGYVIETGKSSNKFGRKRVLLEINKLKFLTIVVALSAEDISYSVLQLDGSILKVEKIPFDLNKDRTTLAATIADHLEKEEAEIRPLYDLVCSMPGASPEDILMALHTPASE